MCCRRCRHVNMDGGDDDDDTDDDTNDDHHDDTDDDSDHKNDSYAAAGAAPGAGTISIKVIVTLILLHRSMSNDMTELRLSNWRLGHTRWPSCDYRGDIIP